MSTADNPDIDTAHVALSQARAILDLLATHVEDGKHELPNTAPGTLGQTLYAAMSEIDRAHKALGLLAEEPPAAG